MSLPQGGHKEGIQKRMDQGMKKGAGVKTKLDLLFSVSILLRTKDLYMIECFLHSKSFSKK